MFGRFLCHPKTEQRIVRSEGVLEEQANKARKGKQEMHPLPERVKMGKMERVAK